VVAAVGGYSMAFAWILNRFRPTSAWRPRSPYELRLRNMVVPRPPTPPPSSLPSRAIVVGRNTEKEWPVQVHMSGVSCLLHPLSTLPALTFVDEPSGSHPLAALFCFEEKPDLLSSPLIPRLHSPFPSAPRLPGAPPTISPPNAVAAQALQQLNLAENMALCVHPLVILINQRALRHGLFTEMPFYFGEVDTLDFWLKFIAASAHLPPFSPSLCAT